MDCVEIESLLEALHDGALDSEVAARVEDHLSTCSSCGAGLAQLRIVSSMLQRSRIPGPTTDLDDHLITAFRQKQKQPQSSPWRFLSLGIFKGSISIPKAALAMAALAVVFAVVAALKIGMMASTPLVVDMTRPSKSTASPQVTLSGPAEQTKFVEVPLIREKIRTVYVDRKLGDGRQTQRTAADSNSRGHELAMSGSVTERGYFTRVNLSGFVPSSEMKTRVIREAKENEK